MSEEHKQITTQEVFALRKAGKLEEAIGHARNLYSQTPQDEWVVRALAWCLFDEVKQLRAKGDLNEQSKLESSLAELASLKLPVADGMLRDNIQRTLGSSPAAKANQLSKDGNHHDAVQLIRPIATAKEASQYEVEAYAWILYRKLRDCKENETEAAVWCLTEFLNCWSSDREANAILFKCILIQAKIHAENWAGLIALVEKLELHKLSPDDFADEQPESDFDSFQDQLLGAVHKCLKKHPAMRQPRPLLQLWLDSWADSFSDEQWPQYHLGHILLWAGGDNDKAKVLLLKTVQRNPSDYWRWQALAEALDGEEKKAAMARGITCKTEDPSFMVPLYRDFANLLADEQALPEAIASLKEAMRLRKLSGNEWRDPLPEWYSSNEAEALPDIHDYAKPFASKADQLLAADLPSHVGVLIKKMDQPGRRLFYCDGLGSRNLLFPLDDIPPISSPAIEVQFQDQPKGVCKVLAWKETQLSDGSGKWIDGVVEQINKDKGLAVIKTSVDDVALLHYNRWPSAENLLPGSFTKLQCVGDPGQRPVVAKFLTVPPFEIADLSISVKGLFRRARDKKFGFINVGELGIFVPPHVAKELLDSTIVEGWAIRSRKKDGDLSWELLPQIIPTNNA